MIQLTDEQTSVSKQGYPFSMFVPDKRVAIRTKLPIWLRIRLSVWLLHARIWVKRCGRFGLLSIVCS
jgi:hypothetical protein